MLIQNIAVKFLDLPCGKMIAGVCEDGLCLFDFHKNAEIEDIKKHIKTRGLRVSEEEHPLFQQLIGEICEYLDGKRKKFEIPLKLVMGTQFEKAVWNSLLEIPYGQTRSYEQQAISLGNIKAIRAVAKANGANQIAIIIPCHRVIGKSGSLTGYAGGIEMKEHLLNLEKKYSGFEMQGRLL